MAFEGDFEKLDVEIQGQVRAISLSDFDTVTKINRAEMTVDDIKGFLARTANKVKASDKIVDEHYDSDLNRTMFQEYWTDLSEFTKKDKKSTAATANKGKFHSRA